MADPARDAVAPPDLLLSARRTARRRRWITAACLAPLFALLGIAAVGPILSGDLWWHLRTGQWILEHARLPDTDPFSHTAGDTHWILQEYGSQVGFALVERAAGLTGLKLMGALLSFAVLLAAYRTARRRVDAPFAAVLAALFALLFALKWELRPHLVSALFILRVESLLFPAAWGRGRLPRVRDVAELFVLSCVWVQLHAEALFAPIAASAGLIGAVLGASWDREGGVRRVRLWALVFGAAVAGTLLSPLAWEPHVYALFRRSVPEQYIEEWFDPWLPPGHDRFAPLTPSIWYAWLACTAAGGLFVLHQAWRRLSTRGEARALSWERIGFLALCVVLALQARRFIWMSWFPAVELVAAGLARFSPLSAGRIAPWILCVLLALPLARTHYCARALELLDSDRYSEDTDAQWFPVHAADFVEAAGLEGNLYHRYEWGGYLGWRLGQRNPVFIDGRTVLFEEIIPERWRAEHEPAYAREVFRERNVRVVVFFRLTATEGGVRPWTPPGGREEWVAVWSDQLAVVWIRRTDGENVERARATFERMGIEFDPEQGFLEAAALTAHPHWLDERFLVPDVLVEPLRATYEPAVGHVRPSLGRAELFFQARMRRNARFELERFIEVLRVDRSQDVRAVLEEQGLGPALEVGAQYARFGRGTPSERDDRDLIRGIGHGE